MAGRLKGAPKIGRKAGAPNKTGIALISFLVLG